MNDKPQVFLSYAHEDRETVLNFYKKLVTAGFQPWMDIQDLTPSQMWKDEITEALSNSDFVLIFLSKNSVSKEGYVNKEIKSALEISKEKPDDSIFLITVKVDDVQVPRALQHIQWVELYSESGWKKLLNALTVRNKLVHDKSFEQLESAVREVKKTKKHIFVAMPFGDDLLEDYFFYGIRVPIKLADFKYKEFRRNFIF